MLETNTKEGKMEEKRNTKDIRSIRKKSKTADINSILSVVTLNGLNAPIKRQKLVQWINNICC